MSQIRNGYLRRAAVFGAQALLATAAPISIGTAWAQDSQPAATAGDETVIVTARRREESLQDTPIAVTVLSAASLERQQVTSTTQLTNVAPSLQFHSYGTLTGNNSAAQVFIRGIGQTDATPAVDPGVGMYIDDVYMGRSVGGVMEFRDIANVQILRGPQGTLFGRNTIGGAVLLTTNAPGDGAGNQIHASLGDDNLQEVYGAIDMPLDGERLAARVSAGFRKRDGYVTRVYDGVDLGNENTYTLQGAMRWRPSDAVTVTLRGDYTNSDEHGSPFVFNGINETQTFPAAASKAAGCPGATFPPPFVPATADPRCANDAQALGPFRNGGTYPALSTLENGGVSLVAEWRVNDVLSFKSVTADRHLQWTGSRDADNTPLLILHTNYDSKSDQVSQELQALITTQRLDGVVGYFYFNEDSFDRLLVPLGNPGTSYDTQRVSMESDSWAAFTEWNLHVSDALSVSAGLRYTDETKSLQATMFNVSPASAAEPPPPSSLCPFGGAPPTQTGCLFLTRNRFERGFTSTIGSASVQYRWNPALMTYLSWSQGFKSGGFNQRYNNAPPGNAPISFDAETAETYEFGVKANPARDVRLNAAIFTTKYDNIQMTYRLGVVPLLFNAGAATISGAELELNYAPTADFALDGSLSYLDTGFDSIINPPPFGSVTPTSVATINSKLPFAPEWQGHIGASYSFHPTGDLLLTPRVDVTYTSKQFFDAGNSADIAQNDAVTLVNGAITLEPQNGPWRLTLSGNNLTDELYPVAGTSSITTSSGYSEIIYARPRNFWVTLGFNF
ncbi:MAG TPA: TonB-dependent receptor [Caulobacterales bacterium]|nr:TonB-dependent receptor [Caulobacterales bacterium]